MSFPVVNSNLGNLKYLNNDVLNEILGYLNERDLSIVMLVCKHFTSLAAQDRHFFPFLKRFNKKATLQGSRKNLTSLYCRYCTTLLKGYSERPKAKSANLFDQKLLIDTYIKLKLLQDENFKLDLQEIAKNGIDLLLILLTENENLKLDRNLIEFLNSQLNKTHSVSKSMLRFSSYSRIEEIEQKKQKKQKKLMAPLVSLALRRGAQNILDYVIKYTPEEIKFIIERDKIQPTQIHLDLALKYAPDYVPYLLEKGAPVATSPNSSFNSLHAAVEYAPQYIKLFIEQHKAMPNNLDLSTAMQHAPDYVPYLLEKGAPVENSLDSSFNTLDCAIQWAHQYIKLLIEEHQAMPNFKHLCLAMLYAPDYVPYLLEKGAPVDNDTTSVYNTLDWAIERAPQYIKLLIDQYQALPTPKQQEVIQNLNSIN